MAAPKAKWGKLNWLLNLNLLNSSFKTAINRLAKHSSGDLARSLRLKNYRGSLTTKLVITLITRAHARIFDMGGPIPDRQAHKGKVMHFIGSRDGKVIFRRKVKSFMYKGVHWVQHGFDDFWNKGKYRGDKPCIVGWEK